MLLVCLCVLRRCICGFLRFCLLSVGLMLLPAAAMAADIGAASIGFQHVMVPAGAGEPVELAIWYPSNAPPALMNTGVVEQLVASGAAVAGNALPLIVISHGAGGYYLSHYDTALALARAGFVVAALTHPGDNYRDQSRSVQIMERPHQVRLVLDYLLAGWRDHVHIDQRRIGIFGFSAGGFTALVNIGGHPDLQKVAPFCVAHSGDFACQLVARSSPEVQKAVAAGVMNDQPDGYDARLRAAVIAAPALGFTFAPAGLQEVKVPVQLWRAEDDRVLPHPWYAEAVRAALPQAPDYHEVPLAGHFDFLAPCSAALAQRVPLICSSAAGFDRTVFHQQFNQAVVDFFVRTLPAS